jgi:LiaI-LiaF-like transmembrane region
MNRYIMIRRLRGPAILLLIGTLALLRQMGAIPHFWRLFWPLLLIMLGVLLLAERAALAAEGYPMFPGWPWHGVAPANQYPAAANSGAGLGSSLDAQHLHDSASGAIVPAEDHDTEKNWNGGQS